MATDELLLTTFRDPEGMLLPRRFSSAISMNNRARWRCCGAPSTTVSTVTLQWSANRGSIRCVAYRNLPPFSARPTISIWKRTKYFSPPGAKHSSDSTPARTEPVLQLESTRGTQRLATSNAL